MNQLTQKTEEIFHLAQQQLGYIRFPFLIGWAYEPINVAGQLSQWIAILPVRFASAGSTLLIDPHGVISRDVGQNGLDMIRFGGIIGAGRNFSEYDHFFETLNFVAEV